MIPMYVDQIGSDRVNRLIGSPLLYTLPYDRVCCI